MGYKQLTWLTVDIISKQMPAFSEEKYSLILECSAAAAVRVAKFMANNIFENYVESHGVQGRGGHAQQMANNVNKQRADGQRERGRER